MQDHPVAQFTEGKSALLVTAIHAGHAMRESVVERCVLTAEERLREEDPFTDEWVTISDNHVIGLRSRFEFDLNRPRESAVYQRPEDAWGLTVWKESLSDSVVLSGQQHHDEFYVQMEQCMARLLGMHALVVVYDLHSYNHQREGAGVYAAQLGNPEINIGTGNVPRTAACARVIHALITSLRAPDANGVQHDVRENVKFRGGFFGRWLHEQYGARVCPIAIEFKKTFMDEWTGTPDPAAIQNIKVLLQRSVPTVIHATHAADRD
jgi:N-formylglutamate amidohydrolase